jgi:hypothetical protein
LYTARSRDQEHYTLEGLGVPFLELSLLTLTWTISSFPKDGIIGVIPTVKCMSIIFFLSLFSYSHSYIFVLWSDKHYWNSCTHNYKILSQIWIRVKVFGLTISVELKFVDRKKKLSHHPSKWHIHTHLESSSIILEMWLRVRISSLLLMV